MKRVLVMTLLLGACLWPAKPGRGKVTRAAMAAMETSFDHRIAKLNVGDPFDLLGTTRGLYLGGYGAVFTAEVGLIVTPPITPFRPSISKEEVSKVRERKLAQMPRLRQAMKDMLVASAASLDTVPPEEQIVVGVTLFHYTWEDWRGMPGQVVMQAQRKTLLDYQAGRIPSAALEAAIQAEEF
jgi:hypothetical protein